MAQVSGVEQVQLALLAAADQIGKLAKFTAPTVASGKVYVATFSGKLCVYGLRP